MLTHKDILLYKPDHPTCFLCTSIFSCDRELFLKNDSSSSQALQTLGLYINSIEPAYSSMMALS